MATTDKRRLTGIASEFNDQEPPAIEVPFEDTSELDSDIDAQIAAITSEFDADERDVKIKIKIFRVLEKKGMRNWLFDILPSELPIMDRVRDDYGTGIYESQVFKNGRLFKKVSFGVEAPKKVNAVVTGELSAIASAMAQQQTLLAHLVEKISSEKVMQTLPVPAVDPIDQMVKLATVLKALQPSNPAPASDPMQMFTVFMKGMEMMKDMGGDSGGGGSNFIDLARDAVKAIGPAIAQSAMTQQPHRIASPKPAQQNAAPAAPQVTAQHEQPSEATDVETDFPIALRLVLKQQLPNLISKAQRGSDPGLYADFIADNVPEATIRQYMLDENLIEKLGRINPEVLNYPEWFAELRTNLIAILSQAPQDANSTEHVPNSENAAIDPVGDT